MSDMSDILLEEKQQLLQEIERVRTAKENALMHLRQAHAHQIEDCEQEIERLKSVIESQRFHTLQAVNTEMQITNLTAKLKTALCVCEAAKLFHDKLQHIEASEEYRAVWESAQLHRGMYAGERWGDERDALAKALDDWEKTNEQK